MRFGVAACVTVLSVLALAVSVNALYSPADSEVTQLAHWNFNKLVLDNDGVSIVQFYAPWCNHCQDFEKTYEKVAETLKGAILVGAMDCDDEKNRLICNEYKVTHTPSIKIFGHEKETNPYTGGNMKDPITFLDQLSGKGIIDAAAELLDSVNITQIKSEADFAAFTESSIHDVKQSKILLVTTKAEASTVYKGLALKLRNSMVFGLLAESDAPELISELAVDEFPSIIVFVPNGDIVRYQGEVRASPLSMFLATFMEYDVAKEASLTETSAVPSLTVKGIEALEEEEDMMLVGFYSAEGEGCKRELVNLAIMAKDMGSIINVTSVELSADDLTKAETSFSVDSAALVAEPCGLQIILLPFGIGKSKVDWIRYPGKMEGKTLQKWVTDEMPMMTMRVTTETMPELMRNEKGGPDFSPKVLLFTNKTDIPGIFNALAVNLRVSRAGFRFGVVQASDEANAKIVEQFKPPIVPHMMMVLPVEREMANKEDEVGLSVNGYQGPMKYNTMIKWLRMSAKVLEGRDKAIYKPETIVTQVNSTEELKRLCEEAGGACMVGIFRGNADKDFHKMQIGAIARTAAMTQALDTQLAYVWIDASVHTTVASQIGIPEHHVPTVLILRLDYEPIQYATVGQSGHFGVTEEKVAKLVNDVMSKKTQTKDCVLPIFPPVEEEVEVVEEEFDLSDIMSEQVKVAGQSKEELIRGIEAEIAAAEKKAAKKKKSKSKKSKKSASKAEL